MKFISSEGGLAATWVVNWALLFAKLVIAILSNSKSIFASLVGTPSFFSFLNFHSNSNSDSILIFPVVHSVS